MQNIFVGLQIAQDGNDREIIPQTLRNNGYEVVDMTDNEMAKLHIRYMVGGHAPLAEKELIYRFEFPERPGALLDFLTCLAGRWNISLFHYRNHGAAFGRVLVGFQVPAEERTELEDVLSALNYSYWDETENPAYKRFLG